MCVSSGTDEMDFLWSATVSEHLRSFQGIERETMVRVLILCIAS